MDKFEIKLANKKDVPLILKFIKDLAEYEKLAHEVVATEEILTETLFGEETGEQEGLREGKQKEKGNEQEGLPNGKQRNLHKNEEKPLQKERRNYAEVIIAYLNNQPVGFALYFHNFSTFLGRPGIYIEDLYVTPEARGKGVGQKLLAFLAKLAKDRKCGRLEWWVLDWNKPAIEFYKKIKAIPMDEWTVFRVTGQALDDLAASGPKISNEN